MADKDRFTVRFWGVRGSIPTPGPDTMRYGGNTPCLEVMCGEHRLILDAGSGLRMLGNQLAGHGGPLTGDLLLSHTHMDHIFGLPFCEPLFNPANRITLWAGHLPAGLKREGVIDSMMTSPLFPVPLKALAAIREYRQFSAGEALSPAAGINILTTPLNHPGGATGYRIDFAGRSFCYITDHECGDARIDDNVVRLIEGADIAAIDSTWTDEELPGHEGWGHSSWQQSVALGARAGVGTMVIFHHDPSHDDDFLDEVAAKARHARAGTIVAREGMLLDV